MLLISDSMFDEKTDVLLKKKRGKRGMRVVIICKRVTFIKWNFVNVVLSLTCPLLYSVPEIFHAPPHKAILNVKI